MSRSPWRTWWWRSRVRNSGGRRTAEGRDQFLRIVPVELGGPSHCPRDARTGLVAKPQGLDHAHAHSSRVALRHLALQSDLLAHMWHGEGMPYKGAVAPVAHDPSWGMCRRGKPGKHVAARDETIDDDGQAPPPKHGRRGRAHARGLERVCPLMHRFPAPTEISPNRIAIEADARWGRLRGSTVQEAQDRSGFPARCGRQTPTRPGPGRWLDPIRPYTLMLFESETAGPNAPGIR